VYPVRRKRERERERKRDFRGEENSQPQEAETTWHGLYPKSCVSRDNRRAFGSRERSREIAREIALFFHHNATPGINAGHADIPQRRNSLSIIAERSNEIVADPSSIAPPGRRVTRAFCVSSMKKIVAAVNAQTKERARANFILQL